MPDNDELAKNSAIMMSDEMPSNDWLEYWYVFLAHAWIIGAITTVFFIVSAFHFFSLPNLYTATTTILAYPADNPIQQSSHQDVQTPTYGQEEEYYGTQLAILTGMEVEEEAIKELGGNVADYTVNAEHVHDTRILSLSVTHRDPEVAAKVANKFAEVFVRESKREGAFIGQQILKFLPDDQKVSNPNPVLQAGGASGDNLSGFSKQEFASSLVNVSNDPQIQQLRSEKLGILSKLTELSQRYKSEHPIILDLNQRLGIIENEIKARTETILSNVKANLAGETNVTNIKVLQEARVPSGPSQPNRFKGILLWTLGGFFISTFFVFLFEFSNQKIRDEHDATAMGLTFLGYIPLTKDFLVRRRTSGYHPEDVDLIKVLKSNSTLADSVANARTHILFSMPYEKSRRIMLTSAIPGEGKSTLAALLAISLTTLGRNILLIDADLRKPSLHRYLGFRNEKGLTDYLVGTATLDEVVQSLKGNSLQMITAGSISPNPSELLSSERFRELLDKCGERFDRVVIDVPPVLYIPDGLIVAKVVHTGILICGAGMVHKRTIQQVKEKFDSVGYSFIGTIINRADFDRQAYRYKYYGNYKSYYNTARQQPIVIQHR